jgi:iron complex transport system ATP-binding protein
VTIEAIGVAVARDGRRVLDGVDVAVGAGELVAVVGPNGAGKSSLVAAMSGDVELAAGEVRLCGAPLSSWRAVDAARRRAVLVQRPVVGFPFTVDQVVRMGRAPWQATPETAEDDDAVADALARADVAHLVDRSVLSLSGGEAARVSLARALAQRTPVLLLDEPTAALDIQHEEHTLRVVREQVARGVAALVVLHDLSLAAAHADRVVVLRDGAVVAAGPPAEVLTAALVSDVYRHPVDVVPHPITGVPLVLASRGAIR